MELWPHARAELGRTPLPLVARNVRQVVLAPPARHSEKPSAVQIRIERLYGEVDRLEMFARCRRVGWHRWGNEVASTIDLAAYKRA